MNAMFDIAHARLAEAESAYSAGDSDRHTNAAQASAAIATAAASIITAEMMTRIEKHLVTIAAAVADSDAHDNLAALAAWVNHTGPGR